MEEPLREGDRGLSDTRRTRVGGVPVDALGRADLTRRFVDDVRAGLDHPRLVLSMNGEGVYRYHRDPAFRAAIDAADLVHADGMSIVRAGNRFTDTVFPERVATTDFFHDLAAACQAEGLSMFLLGGRVEVVDRAARSVREQYPGVRLLGTHHGYFEEGSQEEDALLERLNELRPDIVFVGLGRPRQELWCLRVRDRLSGIAWLKTCGGLFDFLSGDARRAPPWMQRAGLEWFYRMAREPRRLFWRYFVTNIYSLYCFRFRR